ncbi:MAG: nuclear transport factor 2 family protein, partial [Acidobacteriota bacterium]|nr:nuclear transport factor 2 family protein [Acidobacteriota bacterium]
MRAIGSVIFGLLVAVASTPLVAGTSPGKAVDALQDAYRNGSVDGMLAAYSADATFEDINQRHRFEGTEQLRLLLGHIVGMHLTMDLVESRRVIDGDTVVVEYEYRGRLDGAALGASVGKEGCPDLEYVLPATSWYTVRGGEIVEQKDFIDWATFLELRQQMLAA